MFLSLDGTLWVQLVNFAIFFALLNVLFLRPVSAAIRKRRDYINSVTSDYAKYQGEANAVRDNADRVRAEARREAEHLLTKKRGEAGNQAATISADYATKSQATVEDAHARVAAELENARTNEQSLVRGLADAMVERAVGGTGR